MGDPMVQHSLPRPSFLQDVQVPLMFVFKQNFIYSVYIFWDLFWWQWTFFSYCIIQHSEDFEALSRPLAFRKICPCWSHYSCSNYYVFYLQCLLFCYCSPQNIVNVGFNYKTPVNSFLKMMAKSSASILDPQTKNFGRICITKWHTNIDIMLVLSKRIYL